MCIRDRPSGAPVTACAASAQAIGDAMRLINNNEIDIAICGGAEACVDPVSIGGFTSAKALSFGYNETPTHASRPVSYTHLDVYKRQVYTQCVYTKGA